ncbi:reverse gyrase [Methanopyrus sp. SNP6]|uniref:reverse gyrase n=1 Tax=Methanopyrus sp. SNP6 TaxID=1937005 RepID=UPI0011E5BAC8|nr:reverse gyrase [Methanopyrus sp. SNP6]
MMVLKRAKDMVPKGFRGLVESILDDCADLEELADSVAETEMEPEEVRRRDIGNTGPNEPVAIFGSSCVLCGGDCSSIRLTSRIGICERCLPVDTETLREALKEARERHGHVGEALLMLTLVGRYSPDRVEEFFRRYVWPELFTEIVDRAFNRATGFRLYSAQRVWTRRLVKGCSFSILAPTGTGKTSWGSLVAAVLGHAGRRVYYLVPTTTLVRQVEDRIKGFARDAELDVDVVAYHAAMPTQAKQEALERIFSGDFDVLITTAQFLVHRVEDLEKLNFDLILVDDVDAIIRGTGRNVDRVLRVAGLEQEEIDSAYRLATLRRRYYSLRDWLRSLEDRGDKRAEHVREELREVECEIEELEERLKWIKKERDLARIVFMSATGAAAPSRRLVVVRELFDFEVGAGGDGLRNIQDIAVISEPSPEAVERIVRRAGVKGGLIFVPQRLPGEKKAREIVEELTEHLRSSGIEARAIHAGTPAEERERIIDGFSEGDVDVLVAVASPYGVIVRGLDLPQAARYAVFYGVPRQRIRLTPREEDLKNPTYVASALSNLARLLDDRRARSRLEGVADRLWRILRRGDWIRKRLEEAVEPLSLDTLMKLAERDPEDIAEQLDVNRWLAQHVRTLADGVRELTRLLGDPDRVKALAEEATTVAVREEGEEAYLEVPDLRTYVQASGRVSRLFAGGVTFGLSFVLCPEDERELRILNGLIRRMSYTYGSEFEWKSYSKSLDVKEIGLELKKISDEELEELVRKVDEDRERVRKILAGELKPEETSRLARSALMIVESPNKARMIASLFSQRPSRRRLNGGVAYEAAADGFHLTVVATQGHVADLVEESGVHGVLRIDERWVPVYDVLGRCNECGEQVVGSEECPNCGGEVELKIPLLESIRELASEADVILIGTDPDTEGEKIGWDVFNYLGWTTAQVYRTEFHEVTRRGISEALKEENWKNVDAGRVSAQILRRVADRWIGFSLSQDLWDVFKHLEIKLGELPSGSRIEVKLDIPSGVEVVDFRRTFDEDSSVRSRSVRLRRGSDGYVARTRISRGGDVTYTAILLDPNRKLGDRNRVRPELVRVRASVNGEPVDPNVKLEPMTWLSAGRVQTPVLGWIIDRAREYRETEFYACRAEVSTDDVTIRALIEELKVPRALTEKLDEATIRVLSKIAEEGSDAEFSEEEVDRLEETDLFERKDGRYRLSEEGRKVLESEGVIGLMLRFAGVSNR